MRRYERDEYEDLDEYEDDGAEQEEEDDFEDGYEVEETHQPTQEELEYLELRQRLKESIRKQMKKELGSANSGSRDKMNTYRKDNYGSFFGPSQPVIAQRVIQESKSLLENPKLAARITKPNHANYKRSETVKSKPQASHQPRVTNGVKKKVEMLKNTRDYSFLLSEDAEVPVSIKSPPTRTVPVPKSEARSAHQLLSRSKHVVNDRGREVFNGREERKQMVAGSQTKVGQEKMGHASRLSIGSKKQLGSNNGSGPGRPLGPKTAPSKSPVATTGKKVAPSIAKNSVAGVRKPTSSPPLQTPARKPTSSPPLRTPVRKPIPSKLQPGVNKPTPSSLQPSHLKNSSGQRKEYQETSKPKVIPKQANPCSGNQVKQQPPKISARSKLADGRPKERPKEKPGRRFNDEDSEDEKAISMIRKMFRYNPNKYQDADDDSDMEANFDDIMREESRSAKIAQKEDEEQLRLLEEEERRRQARMSKKRKLSHQ